MTKYDPRFMLFLSENCRVSQRLIGWPGAKYITYCIGMSTLA